MARSIARPRGGGARSGRMWEAQVFGIARARLPIDVIATAQRGPCLACMTRRLWIPIFLVAATAAVAAADTRADAPSATASDRAASDCARARKAGKTCVLTFGGDTIKGNSPTGDGTVVTGRGFLRGPSLIHIREDFRAEIIKSAEDLD